MIKRVLGLAVAVGLLCGFDYTQSLPYDVITFEALPSGTPVWLVEYSPATYVDGEPVYFTTPDFSREYTMQSTHLDGMGNRHAVDLLHPANYWELFDDADLSTAIWGILPCGSGLDLMTDCSHGDDLISIYIALPVL